MALRLVDIRTSEVIVDAPAGFFAEIAPWCGGSVRLGPQQSVSDADPTKLRISIREAACTADGVPSGVAPVQLHADAVGFRTSGFPEVVVYHPDGHHYHIQQDSARVVICDQTSATSALDSFQVIRGVLIGMAAVQGWRAIHGGLVSVGDRNVLLVGPKGAGKTSFLLSLLQARPDARFITNDKGLLQPAGLYLSGLPYAVGIGEGALLALGRPLKTARRTAEGKALVWPADLEAALGRQSMSGCGITEVWVCHLELASSGVHIGRPFMPDRASFQALHDFSHRMTPVWLLELLKLPLPEAPDIAVLRRPIWRKAVGNPWLAGWHQNLPE